MVGARVALVSDQVNLARLHERSRAEVETQRGGRRYLELLAGCHDTSTISLVGLVEASVVGFALLRRDAATAVLDAIYVEVEARDVGVGHQLLERALSTARDWGCTSLESVVFAGDRNTKNFFEAHGMASRLLQVSRPL
ncbi:MAG: GNAT family N-acetyltransferase [Microthrixaceae bacterium]|nr:GNAT family N-acetyltransferase [Microthrixaceae bacterium]